MLAQAAERWRQGLAKVAPRPPQHRPLPQPGRGYLASPLADDPFVNLAGPEGWDGLDAWRAELTQIVAGELRPAFARYLDVLRDELLPRSRPDDQPGLVHLPDGDGRTRRSSRSHRAAAHRRELHQVGLDEVASLAAEYQEIGGRLWGTKDLAAIFARLTGDESLRYRGADEILAHNRTCLDAATAAMGDWFGIVPEAVRAHPGARLPGGGCGHCVPAPPAPTAAGRASTTSTCATPPSGRAETASICFHEAIPGHHLQLAIATERVAARVPAAVLGPPPSWRGWALYTERLADEMGLYESDLDRLGMLAGDSLAGVPAGGRHRAARPGLDPAAGHRLHGGQLVDHEEIEVEVDRYVGMPGQALAYKVGQREILRLQAKPGRARLRLRHHRLPRHRAGRGDGQPAGAGPGSPPEQGCPRACPWRPSMVTARSSITIRWTTPASTAPAMGASQNNHSCSSTSPPTNTAGAVEQAGFTEVLVTGMLMRWIRVELRPMAREANPMGASRPVTPRIFFQQEEREHHLDHRGGHEVVAAGRELGPAVGGEVLSPSPVPVLKPSMPLAMATRMAMPRIPPMTWAPT